MTSLYDIGNYTDAELVAVLDMNNPSMREMNAKIRYNIAKYGAIDTEDGRQMKTFMEDIYDHFFEDSGVKEGFASMSAEKKASKVQEATPGLATGIVHTTNFDYIAGNVNPLLKNTVTRTVIVDSSFRDNIESSSATNYTFNLSNTLQDVVSMRLTGVQIPCSWYTISTAFGSNFFYINGVSPGIDGNAYSIKVSVNAGNYDTPNKLIIAINTSMKLAMTTLFPDILYGTTNISYSESTLKATFNFGFKQVYNESAYYLYFPQWTSPQTTIGEFSSIPGFLGFNRAAYAPTCIYSNYSAGYLTSGTNALTYKLTELNNFITIHTYIGPDAYTSSTTTTETIVITSSLSVSSDTSGYYYMAAIIADFDTQLKASEKLIGASLSIESVADINSTLPFAIALRLRVNRRTTINAEYLKTVVVFPLSVADDNKIWCGTNSCFQFATQINDMSDIVSETPNYFTRYMVLSSPYAKLKCTKAYYGEGTTTANDMQFYITNSTSAGYLVSELYAAISTGMTRLKTQQTDAGKGFFCNVAMTDFLVSPTPKITIDINRAFSETSFALDITGSILTTSASKSYGICNIELDLFSIGSVYTSTFPVRVGGYPITSDSNKIILSGVATETFGLPDHIISLTVPASGIYTSILEMQTLFNATMTSSTNNPTPNGVYMRGTSISLSVSSVLDNTVVCVLTVGISASLTEQDYRLELYDPASNTGSTVVWSESTQIWESTNNIWYNSLHFASETYTLSETTADGYLNGNYATVSAVSDVLSNELYLTSNNNYFYVRAIYDAAGGAYSSGSENDYLVTIDPVLYPVNQFYPSLTIKAAIQAAFDAVVDLAGTTISINLSSLTTTIRLCVNRVFSGADYALLFYDAKSFTKCIPNVSTSVQNVTIDSTLGWILGFRDSVQYVLSPENVSSGTNNEGDTYYSTFTTTPFSCSRLTRSVVITADTSVNIDLYNYLLVCVDDFSMNHLTNGVVTISAASTSIPLPSYANRTSLRCTRDLTKSGNFFDGALGQYTHNQLTAAQVYSANQLLANSKSDISKNYASGMLTNNALCLVQITSKNLVNGNTYTESGSSLSAQVRSYFGPVNLRRMNVQLLTRTGKPLDLNNSNWSFTMSIEQLYSTNST